LLAPSEYEGSPTRGYLDTATYGLPPRATVAAVEQTLASWQGRGSWLDWEQDGEACRELFAQIVGAQPEDIAYVAAASVAAGIVAASLPAEADANIVLYERDFDSVLFPWRPLAERGVELRMLPLERLAEGIDERTTLVAVSLVQSSDGRMPDLAAIKAAGTRLFLDGTQAVGSIPVSLEGVDYLVAHSYKWLLSPRGLCVFYVRPERLPEITPWLAGWKSRSDPFEDYYGAPELASDAHRLDVSIPWFSAAGARARRAAGGSPLAMGGGSGGRARWDGSDGRLGRGGQHHPDSRGDSTRISVAGRPGRAGAGARAAGSG
jgi:selenocysteine lyase/cysteine desulfurase